MGFFKRFRGKGPITPKAGTTSPATPPAPVSSAPTHSASVSARVRVESRDDIRELAGAAGLDGWADKIADAALPSVRLELDDHLGDPMGTRFGGKPAVPAGFEWPERDSGPSLTFIAQVRLDDIAGLGVESSLPANGLLSFFYEAEEMPWGGDRIDRDAWRVVWFPDLGELSVSEPPPGPAIDCALPDHGASYIVEWTVPDSFPEEAMRLGYSPGETPLRDAYYAFHDRLSGERRDPIHRLLGHPDEVQGSVPLDCAVYSRGLQFSDLTDDIRSSARDWRLVLQVDSDDRLGTMWGDVGRIYFMLNEESAADQDFDHAWLILQCS
jgi:hypothetical protein